MACGTNLLDAGGYGRVATTAQIKAVLLCNRYLENLHYFSRPGAGLTTRRAVTNQNQAASAGSRRLLETYPRVSSAQAH
jgi:hypothetical protein